MVVGGINIYQSRRTRFNECKYWKRDTSIRDLSVYKHKQVPSGVFYAKEENSKMFRKNAIGGAFLYDENSLTISTNDYVNIEVDDVVEFQDNLWRVSSVQVTEKKQQREFMRVVDKTTYLELKR